jgi:glycogen debranching enzyme
MDTTLAWGREICGELDTAERREWLCTNGIGGFASGTVAGSATRRYHGLLVAALQPPLGRTLLGVHVHETVAYGGRPFEAIRAYHAATGDDGLLKELFPVLESILAWHRAGTRYGIHVDPADGLLASGELGVQLTWMDARVGDWVVTPRTGKAVDVNALWYNALRAMAAFAARLHRPAAEYGALADRVATGFERFWHPAGGYCHDVIDTPQGDDPTLRPNQILAVSLPASPLSPSRQRAVVDACAARLLTSQGLRSLTPDHPQYRGRYGGDPWARDEAYHQGTVWAWLLGPFALAHLRVYGDPAAARAFLAPLAHHLGDYGVGSIAEIFEGDAPFRPAGCVAQAWSVAETLRAWHALAPAPGRARRPVA